MEDLVGYSEKYDHTIPVTVTWSLEDSEGHRLIRRIESNSSLGHGTANLILPDLTMQEAMKN